VILALLLAASLKCDQKALVESARAYYAEQQPKIESNAYFNAVSVPLVVDLCAMNGSPECDIVRSQRTITEAEARIKERDRKQAVEAKFLAALESCEADRR